MNNDFEDINKIYFFLKKTMSILFIMFLISYIAYHLYKGNYGFKNYINKQSIINKKNIDAKNLEKEISNMNNKIEKLQDDNLDSDLLDEEIRKNTGYAKQNEIVMYSNDFLEE